ncbi:MAG: hypothetical protein IPJ43_00970 [Saprospiraceae bacterium]|nr:hypothetical protein [Saprospiraceae bacterium]MBK9994115.1 hypothetical protein [Saprospiraceae bacterium]
MNKSQYIIPVISIFILVALSSSLMKKNNFIANQSDKIKGLTVVAPPEPFPRDPMIEIKNVNANWIAVIPYAFTPFGEPTVRYNQNGWQWWGERPEGIIETVTKAHQSQISVMLKPQVYIHNSWVGYLDFKTEEEWLQWESKYEEYISTMVDIAIQNKIELFCIGTELNISVVKREKFWRKLIQNIRSRYNGKLSYCSNWDRYEEVGFWEELDYIGISAYFPLREEINPTKESLMEAWKPIVAKLKLFSESKHKKILFTEYGYLSVDGCAGKLWEIEPLVKQKAVNQKAQADALDALYSSFWNEDFWAGGFLWKWFPHGKGHEEYIERDYDPQNKLAEKTIKHWFSK